MRRFPVIIVSALLLLTGVGSAVLLGHAADGRKFVGYWMGIDPLDGGDSRRGITRNNDRTFSVIGRDTVFTLCDGTDRAIVTVKDATIVGSALVSDNFLITCTNNRASISLKVRYDFIDKHIIRETLTTQEGKPVDKIIFHLVGGR